VNFLADSHCHLDYRLFDADREEVIQRSREAGVTRILNPGIDLASSRDAVSLAGRHPHIYAAVGVHPNDAGGWKSDTIAALRELAKSSSKVVAIGEIGLDYYRNQSDPVLQRRIFREQLELAGDLGLPVIIHSRQAIREVISTLTTWRYELGRAGSPLLDQPGVLHAFEGDFETALQAIDMNFFLGVGGPITFRNGQEKQALFSALPLHALLLETDAPFLAPHPHRGERNEPAYVRWVAESLATLTNTTFSNLAKITSNNAARLFAWRETV
jgi:TatD DNase family protein